MQDNKNDQLIEIPDFRIFLDFVNWTKTLSEEEIQSWRAKDWNKMYEKLFAFINKSPEIEATLKEGLKNGKYYIRNDGQEITISDLSVKQQSDVKRRIFLQEPEALMSLAKLYKNYRMEPEQIKKIYELAQKAGEKSATTGEISTARTSTDSSCYSLLNTAETIEKIVYEQSSYPKMREKLGLIKNGLRANIEVKDNMDANGGTSNIEEKPIIEIRKKKKFADVPLHTIFHESAHAHLQIFKYELIEKLAQIKPIEEFSDDFVQLLTYNNMLYINDKVSETIKFAQELSLVINTIESSEKLLKTPTETRTGKNDYFEYYRKQPLEYFARLYGDVAERSFRRHSSQYSERGILLALKYLSKIDKELGEPSDITNDKHGNIIFKFNKNCCPEIKNLFTGKDNPLEDQIEIKSDGRLTTICMKQIFFPENKWKEWEEKIWQPYCKKKEKISECLRQAGIRYDTGVDEKGNLKISCCNGYLNDKYLDSLFTGKNNPLDGKVKRADKSDILLISLDGSTLRDWKKWEEKILKPMQTKIEYFARAFTSKYQYEIKMKPDGCAGINFDKDLPYSDTELFGKIYGVDGDRCNIKDKIKILYFNLVRKEGMAVSSNSIKTPPVYSKEFDRLLKLFQKDKIGFIEAEQKRDVIRRYRRMKTNKIIQNVKSMFSKRTQ